MELVVVLVKEEIVAIVKALEAVERQDKSKCTMRRRWREHDTKKGSSVKESSGKIKNER